MFNEGTWTFPCMREPNTRMSRFLWCLDARNRCIAFLPSIVLYVLENENECETNRLFLLVLGILSSFGLDAVFRRAMLVDFFDMRAVVAPAADRVVRITAGIGSSIRSTSFGSSRNRCLQQC